MHSIRKKLVGAQKWIRSWSKHLDHAVGQMLHVTMFVMVAWSVWPQFMLLWSVQSHYAVTTLRIWFMNGSSFDS